MDVHGSCQSRDMNVIYKGKFVFTQECLIWLPGSQLCIFPACYIASNLITILLFEQNILILLLLYVRILVYTK